MSAPKEEWKCIEGYEGYYQVSDQGRVRSIDRTVDSGRGGAMRINGKTLSLEVNNYGYQRACLSKNGKQTNAYIHRLVLEAFVGPAPDDYECNHRNGNKENNCLTNLEWVTHSENQRHALNNGLRTDQGEAHPRAKLTADDVREVRTLYASGEYTQRELGNMFGVSESAIGHIITGKNWARVT